MNFSQPQYLHLMYLVVGAGLVLIVWLSRGHRFGLAEFSRQSALIRLLALAILLVGLASPFMQKKSTSESAALVLLDVSDSMETSLGQALLDKAGFYERAGLDLEVLPFALEAAATGGALSDLGGYAAVRSSSEKLGVKGTSLEKALRRLSSYEDVSVLLLSDAQDNQSSLSSMLSALRPEKTRIYPIVPDEIPRPEESFRIAGLMAPLQAAAQSSVNLKVSLENNSLEAQRGQLQIFHDDKEVFSRPIEVGAGRQEVFSAESSPALEGIREIRAVLKPEAVRFPSDTRSAYLASRERDSVLLLSSSAEDERLLKPVLESQAWKLESFTLDTDKTKLPELSRFSVVILNNVALNSLPPQSDAAVADFVKAGGGLVMAGGSKSFGLGGYKDSQIEEVLPLESVPPQTVSKRLNVAVELVLDKSRSMEFGAKLEYVKEAAKEVIKNLKDDDYIGLIGFDTVPFEVIRLMQLSSGRAQALERVGRLYPSGKTNLLPAMEQARLRLSDVQAGRKHMIVLTDGQIPDAGPYYLELVRKMRLSGITLSTVMVGSESDFGFLHGMGDAGGGSFYQTDDARSIPRIFLSDIKVSTGERSMKEESEFVVRTGPSGLQSTTIQGYPPLRGYVQTAAKKGASLELVLMGSEGLAEPLLASWNYKQGRSIAFTSDTNGRWSSYWAPWSRFQNFWGDIVSAARGEREDEGAGVEFDLRHGIESGALVLDLSLYDEKVSQNLDSTVSRPDGRSEKISWQKVSRGHFRALLTKPLPGKYELGGRAGGKRLGPVAFHLDENDIGERRGLGLNMQTLERLASLSGGRINPDPEELKRHGSLQYEKRDISHYFFIAALLVLLLEILWRELLSHRFHLKLH